MSSMSTQVFRYPRWLAFALMALSAILVVGLLISPSPMLAAGWLVTGIFVATPFVIGLLGLRFRIIVGEATVDMVGLRRQQFALADVESIGVARGGKGAGLVATVKLKGGRSFYFDNTVRGFRELLDLLSERTSVPVAKPVWDPDILGDAKAASRPGATRDRA
jgi:hypothetical protein